MGWWGKIIGGTVGMAVAGPAGAVIGVGLGAVADGAVDDDPNKGIPVLDIQHRFIEDDFGCHVQLFFRRDVPNGAVAVNVLHDSRGRTLKAVPAFADNGRFVVHRGIERGRAEFYVPYSALKYRRPGTYTLTVTVLMIAPGAEAPTTLGHQTFGFELPPGSTWSKVAFLQPLMGLCMTVLRADGDISARGVKIIRKFFGESFDIPISQHFQLRDLMKEEPTADLHTLCQGVQRRMPALKGLDILALLAEVAQCEGPPSSTARNLIKETSIYLGIPENRWFELEQKLELRVKISDPWELLGVQRGTSAMDIKKAYRTKVSGLHPDKVAHMDPEIQELARTRTVELREAYDTVMDGSA
jgi:DnaJ-domain-containing protein 1